MKAWGALALLILFELLADIAAKEFQQRNFVWLSFVAVVFYTIANSFWLLSLYRGMTLSLGATIFSIASALIAVLIGAGVYHEVISFRQWVGIGFGLIALLLVTWEG